MSSGTCISTVVTGLSRSTRTAWLPFDVTVCRSG